MSDRLSGHRTADTTWLTCSLGAQNPQNSLYYHAWLTVFTVNVEHCESTLPFLGKNRQSNFDTNQKEKKRRRPEAGAPKLSSITPGQAMTAKWNWEQNEFGMPRRTTHQGRLLALIEMFIEPEDIQGHPL